MTKETPVYERLKPLAADWIDLFGYWAPTVLTTDADAEYQAVRETAALMDFSMLRKIDIDGAGSLDLVNGIVARDVSKLSAGQIAYGPLCDEDGKMVDDCTVMVRSDSGDSVRVCGANDRDFEIFTEQASGRGISVHERTDEMAHLCLQGPLSRGIVQSLTSSDVSSESFPYYRFREDIALAGVPTFITRMGYTAELGYEIFVDRDRALELWDALIEAGVPEGMMPIGVVALGPVRLEGGFILGGVEYDSTSSPYECGLGWAVALEKGEFQGREGLRRDQVASRLRLATVVLESGGDSATGSPIHVGGEVVGAVTESATSPLLDGKTVGLAKIWEELCAPGTAIEVVVDGEHIPGTVASHPAYDPERVRVRG